MNEIKITTLVDIDLPEHEVEVKIDPEEILDEVGLTDCLDHFDDANEVMDWLDSNADTLTIGEWVAEDDGRRTFALRAIATDDEQRAAAIEYLGGSSGAPKLTDGDLALIVTALSSIAAECERIGACAAEGSVREAFQQSAAAYRAVRERIES